MEKKSYKLNTDSKFDLDLKFGQIAEEELAKIFTGGIKIEVKTERACDSGGLKWNNTGNIFIEFQSRGKASGIKTTEATYWFHILSSPNGIIQYGFFVQVKKLRRWLKDNHSSLRVVNGGDSNTSKGYLIPIKDIHKMSNRSKQNDS